MSNLAPANADIGHNNPPSDAELLKDRLNEKNQQMIDRQAELIKAAGRIPENCTDDETAGKLADMIKMISACHKSLDGTRVAEKEPYLTLGRVVDGFFKKLTDDLDGAKTKVNKVLTKYMQFKESENRRLLREQQEQEKASADKLAQEAAEMAAANMPEAADQTMSEAASMEKQAEKTGKLAEAKPADLSRTRGDYGGVASLRTKWVAQNIDYENIDLNALRAHISRTEIEKAANAWAKVNKSNTLKGALVHEITETVVR